MLSRFGTARDDLSEKYDGTKSQSVNISGCSRKIPETSFIFAYPSITGNVNLFFEGPMHTAI